MSKEFEEFYTIPIAKNYKITKDGKVLSIARKVKGGKHNFIWKKEKILTQQNHRGYRRVCLSIGGKSLNFLVHRLVAITFIDNPYNLGFVNHKDGNKENNKVDNLEWCSHAYNIKHAYKNGLIPSRKEITGKGEQATHVKLTETCVRTIREMHDQDIPQRDIAKLFNINKGTVWQIIHRKTWTHI